MGAEPLRGGAVAGWPAGHRAALHRRWRYGRDFCATPSCLVASTKTMEEAFRLPANSEVDETLTLAGALRSPRVSGRAKTSTRIMTSSAASFQHSCRSRTRSSKALCSRRRATLPLRISFWIPSRRDVGDCYLISLVIATGVDKARIVEVEVACIGLRSGFEEAVYLEVSPDVERAPETDPITVTGLIPMAGKLPRYARSGMRGEFWPALIEKAYIIKERPNLGAGRLLREGEVTVADYQAVAVKPRSTIPPLACQALVGGVVRGHAAGSDQGKKFSGSGSLHTESAHAKPPWLGQPKAPIGGADFGMRRTLGITPIRCSV